ncbi:hypothetical protein CPB83DRAFT_860569 [Crepidotus variabilis]|uniref:Macro domain-containing protein n=1 Tax=Crepidotus variabilis TaxID=179855 RepID=A0A9P6E956_9AGAR|nr:hypothetical protein CPB83DRAFT_860569 [Crepidotus variabilis]
MATVPDSSTPPSPRHSTSSSQIDEVEEKNMISLGSIKTIAELYKITPSVIRRAEVARYKPSRAVERVSLFQGDITKLKIDAIVNAANRSLLGGGGVDGAIHNAAGPKLLDECRTLNGCETGKSKITKGYDLPARHIIHTVGPIYSEKDKDEKAEQLASCYETCLEVAIENEVRHVAFCSISTGIYSYPIVAATRIALETARDVLDSEKGSKIERIIFVVWSDKDKNVYQTLIPEYFPPYEEQEVQEEAESVVVETSTQAAPAEKEAGDKE